jgi:hypothetical protein
MIVKLVSLFEPFLGKKGTFVFPLDLRHRPRCVSALRTVAYESWLVLCRGLKRPTIFSHHIMTMPQMR